MVVVQNRSGLKGRESCDGEMDRRLLAFLLLVGLP